MIVTIERTIMIKLVLIESPYRGLDAAATQDNINYARRAMLDSIRRGEAPFASHLLYTQPGILDDSRPLDRELGIAVGLAWGEVADLTAVYTDLGVSAGMRQGIDAARAAGRPVEYRRLNGPVENRDTSKT